MWLEDGETLNWTRRMKIALDVAKGFAFLHALETPIFYHKFKTSNILLDMVSCQQSTLSFGYIPKNYLYFIGTESRVRFIYFFTQTFLIKSLISKLSYKLSQRERS